MTRNEKIQAAAAFLRERAENTTASTSFIVTITDEAVPAIELTPDRERISKDVAFVDLMCSTFYHMGEVVDLSRAFNLTCYITFKGNSYCVRIY